MSYNNSHYTNLGQLKAALQSSRNEVTTLAALVVGTIEDLILQADISIPTSAWAVNQDSATLAEGYEYKADVSSEGLIENANVNVTLDIPSQAIAAKAQMSATVYISEDAEKTQETGKKYGTVRFFAKTHFFWIV